MSFWLNESKLNQQLKHMRIQDKQTAIQLVDNWYQSGKYDYVSLDKPMIRGSERNLEPGQVAPNNSEPLISRYYFQSRGYKEHPSFRLELYEMNEFGFDVVLESRDIVHIQRLVKSGKTKETQELVIFTEPEIGFTQLRMFVLDPQLPCSNLYVLD